MRLLLTTIIMTTLAQPVWAFSIGDLYRFCEPYFENSMSLTGLSEPEMDYTLACLGYHNGVLDTALAVCKYSENSGDKAAFGTSITDPNESVRRFMIYAKDARDEWDAGPFPPYWISNTCKE